MLPPQALLPKLWSCLSDWGRARNRRTGYRVWVVAVPLSMAVEAVTTLNVDPGG